jgi:hypothetical protein
MGIGVKREEVMRSRSKELKRKTKRQKKEFYTEGHRDTEVTE